MTWLQDDPGVVICIDDERHKLSDFSKVRFSEVQGMTELNSLGPVAIKVRGPSCTIFLNLQVFLAHQFDCSVSPQSPGPHSFSICDTSSFSDYERGGIVTEVKEPLELHFVSILIYLPVLLFVCDSGSNLQSSRLLGVRIMFQASGYNTHTFLARI